MIVSPLVAKLYVGSENVLHMIKGTNLLYYHTGGYKKFTFFCFLICLSCTAECQSLHMRLQHQDI